MLLIPHVDITSPAEFWVRVALSKRQHWIGRAFGSWGLLEMGRQSASSSEGRRQGALAWPVWAVGSQRIWSLNETQSENQPLYRVFPLVQMCNISARQLGEVEINGQAMSILYSFRWLHPELLILAHTNITEFSTETTTYLKTWLMLALSFIK